MAKMKKYMRTVKRASSPVTQRQSGFATGISKVVKTFVNTKQPMRKRKM